MRARHRKDVAVTYHAIRIPTDDIITGLFLRVDTALADVPKHPQAHLYSSELVTLALLFARKGDGPRRFYRWLTASYRAWFPRLPEHTRLFRLFAAHADWTGYFLAQPTTLGVAGTYGIELRHLWRKDRADQQIGGKGLSHYRWIVGTKLAYVVNQYQTSPCDAGHVCGPPLSVIVVG